MTRRDQVQVVVSKEATKRSHALVRGWAWWVTAAAALAPCACDWREFDSFEDEAPVVLLERAPGTTGFGRSLVGASDGDIAVVLVGGAPSRSPSAAFNIGFEQNPGTDAAQQGYCSRDNAALDPCLSADQPAYFPTTNSRERNDVCFAHAWGQTDDAANPGILVRCFRDGADITLRAPSTARRRHAADYEINEDNQPLWMASDRGEEPWLVAALENQNLAWYYRPNSQVANELPVPEAAGNSFGSRSAIGLLGDDSDGPHLMAISAAEEGQVWLYRAQDEDPPVRVGCLGERDGFGRSLAMGRVDEDEFDDLVVADARTVTVFSGAALSELPAAFSDVCTLSALPANAILGSFGCGSELALSGCNQSKFGASLAVGDVDGDGDGEVIVGAPEMVVNGHSRAGAALLYDVEGDDPHELSDVYYISSAESGDLLGTSVAAVPQEGHDIVVAGGPGNGKVGLFFCSDLTAPSDRQGRCAL